MTGSIQTPQTVVFSGYRDMTLLGQGAFAKVYRATQVSTGQPVAIKHLQPHPNADNQRFANSRRQRFLREANICAQLHNPHIVRLIDQGFCHDESPYAVFEYIPGETLADYLSKKGALDGEQAQQFMLQVLDALACAHNLGIVHRDLKPQNIMVSQTGTQTRIKILDFGISGWQKSETETQQKLTLTQETLGTPRYSAPEQLRNETTGPYTDLYTWGLIMVECLSGTPMINATSIADSIQEQLAPTPLALPPFIAQHPLASLLRQVLTKQSRKRLACAREVYQIFKGMAMHTLLAKTVSPYSMSGNETIQSHTSPSTEKRFMTVLCCRVTLQGNDNITLSEEGFDQLLDEKIQYCYGFLSHYGGRPGGSMGNILLAYFEGENSAETAARTAILIKKHATQWRRTQPSKGITISIEQAIHCGNVLSGMAFHSANQVSKLTLHLLHKANRNEIVTSAIIYQKLEPIMAFSKAQQASSLNNRAYILRSADHSRRDRKLQNRSIVGREKELSLLQNIFTDAKVYSQAVTIVGDAGMGKSALIHQAVNQLATPEHTVIYWYGQRCHQPSALYPVLEEVRQYLGLDASQSPNNNIDRLKKALQQQGLEPQHHSVILAHWLGLSSQSIVAEHHLYSPEKQQALLFEALGQLTGREEQHRIIVVEDIHWLDRMSLDFIHYLSQQSSEQPFLLLASCRQQTAAAKQLVNIDFNHGDKHLIHLTALDKHATTQIIHQHLARNKKNDLSIERIAQRSSGIPLFIKELTQWENDKAVTNDPIPSSLGDLLSSRIQQAGRAKPLLYCLAVYSQSINEEQLLALMHMPKKDMAALIQRLLIIGLIKQTPNTYNTSVRYHFQHALHQEATYRQMSAEDKQHYHLRIAHYLCEDEQSAQAASIAQHFAAARDYTNAVEQGLNAVQYLLGIAASAEALTEIERVLQWCELLEPAAAHRSQLRARQYQLHATTNLQGWAHPEVSASVKQLQDTIPHYIAPFAQHIDGVCYWTLATYYHVASQRAKAQTVSQNLRQTSIHLVDKPLLLSGYCLEGVTHWIDGHYDQAASALKQALAAATGTSNTHMTQEYGLDAEIWASAALANVYWFQGKTARAFEQAQQSVDQAVTLNHLPSLGIALMYQTFIHQHEQDYQSTQQCANRVLSLANTYGLPAVEGYAKALLGWATNDALLIEQTLQQLQALGCLLGSSYMYSLLAEVYARDGDHHNALAWVNEGLQAVHTIDEFYFLAPLYQQKALYLYALNKNSSDSAIEQCLRHSQQWCNAQKIRTDCYVPVKHHEVIFRLYEELIRHNDCSPRHDKHAYSIAMSPMIHPTTTSLNERSMPNATCRIQLR